MGYWSGFAEGWIEADQQIEERKKFLKSMEFDKDKFNQTMSLQQAQFDENKRQFELTLEQRKAEAEMDYEYKVNKALTDAAADKKITYDRQDKLYGGIAEIEKDRSARQEEAKKLEMQARTLLERGMDENLVVALASQPDRLGEAYDAAQGKYSDPDIYDGKFLNSEWVTDFTDVEIEEYDLQDVIMKSAGLDTGILDFDTDRAKSYVDERENINLPIFDKQPEALGEITSRWKITPDNKELWDKALLDASASIESTFSSMTNLKEGMQGSYPIAYTFGSEKFNEEVLDPIAKGENISSVVKKDWTKSIEGVLPNTIRDYRTSGSLEALTQDPAVAMQLEFAELAQRMEAEQGFNVYEGMNQLVRGVERQVFRDSDDFANWMRAGGTAPRNDVIVFVYDSETGERLQGEDQESASLFDDGGDLTLPAFVEPEVQEETPEIETQIQQMEATTEAVKDAVVAPEVKAPEAPAVKRRVKSSMKEQEPKTPPPGSATSLKDKNFLIENKDTLIDLMISDHGMTPEEAENRFQEFMQKAN